jgi:hypothetical protein
MDDETVSSLMETFTVGEKTARDDLQMCPCPIFVRKNYLMGRLRYKKLLAKKSTPAQVQAKMASFEEEEGVENAERPDQWRLKPSTAMTEAEKRTATEAWSEGEAAERERLSAAGDDAVGLLAIRSYVTGHLKLSALDLHDACIVLGEVPPVSVSILAYLNILRAAVCDASQAFRPQCVRTHTKPALAAVLRCLKRGGAKLSVQGNKRLLSERLATVMQTIMERGERTKEYEDERGLDEDADLNDFTGDASLRADSQPSLIDMACLHAQVPDAAIVTAVQAESSLGHNLADEFDEGEDEDAADKDVRAERLALAGVDLNPPDVDYTCLALEFAEAPDSLLEMAGNPARDFRPSAATFDITKERASKLLLESISDQRRDFIAATASAEGTKEYEERVAVLDPTQFRAFDAVRSWAEETALAERGDTGVIPPPVRMLLLGTAGTGKTVTVKCAVQAARLAFGEFDSVLMAAHTGVAAANMGGGASTVNSLFKLGGDDFTDDLEGDKLTELCARLSEVKLLVIDAWSGFHTFCFITNCVHNLASLYGIIDLIKYKSMKAIRRPLGRA